MERILEMGFSEAAATHFMERCGGDWRRAVDALVAEADWQPPRPDPDEAASVAEARRIEEAEREAERLRREEEAASLALVRRLTEEESGHQQPAIVPGGGGAAADLIDLSAELEPEPEPQPQPARPGAQDELDASYQAPHRGHVDDAAVAAQFAQQDEVEAMRLRMAEMEREMASQRVVHEMEKQEIAQRLRQAQEAATAQGDVERLRREKEQLEHERQQAMRRWKRDQHKVKRAEVTAVQAADEAARAEARAAGFEQVAAQNAAEKEELQEAARRNAAADHLAYPDYWAEFPEGQDQLLVELVGRQEPELVAERERLIARIIQQGAPFAAEAVVSLQRVQNKTLWQRYAAEREILQKRRGNANERGTPVADQNGPASNHLYHGAKGNVQAVLDQGPMARYSVQAGGHQGTWTCEQASYSCGPGYAPTKQVFACRAVLGTPGADRSFDCHHQVQGQSAVYVFWTDSAVYTEYLFRWC
jgi:hypothetical protein